MLILKCNVYLSSPIDFGLQRIWRPKQQGSPKRLFTLPINTFSPDRTLCSSQQLLWKP